MKKNRFQQNRRSLIKRNPTYNYHEDLSSITEYEVKSQKQKRKNRQRQENSLGELTKNFIKYIKEKKNKEVNINDVVKKLKVKKRRIYDITNVLEGYIYHLIIIVGIGFIKKIEKTKIKWLKDELFKDELDEDNDEYEHQNAVTSKQKSTYLIKEHDKINTDIIQLRENIDRLLDSDEFAKYGYVSFNDLKCLCEDESVNLLAIHAPIGTTMDIPDPESCALVYKNAFEVIITLK